MKKEDILTGFLVREELVPFMNKLIHEEVPFTLVLMDLNNFKKFNDKYGHLFGDEVLKYVASTIRLTFSGEGEVFRYGGDEFIIIFPKKEKKHIFNLFKIYNKTLQRRPFLYGRKLFRITASYGISAYPLDGSDTKTLISKADRAMYFSKRRGKGVIADIAKVGSIKVLRQLLRFFIWGGIFTIILYLSTHPENFKRFLKKFKSREVETPAPEKEISKSQKEEPFKITPYRVKITLRDGSVIKGYIVDKDDKEIKLKITGNGVEGYITIDKNLILEIR